jgi:hypothetical protein
MSSLVFAQNGRKATGVASSLFPRSIADDCSERNHCYQLGFEFYQLFGLEDTASMEKSLVGLIDIPRFEHCTIGRCILELEMACPIHAPAYVC